MLTGSGLRGGRRLSQGLSQLVLGMKQLWDDDQLTPCIRPVCIRPADEKLEFPDHFRADQMFERLRETLFPNASGLLSSGLSVTVRSVTRMLRKNL